MNIIRNILRYRSEKSFVLSTIFNGTILVFLYIIYKLIEEGIGYYIIPVLVAGIALIIYIWYAPLYYVLDQERKLLIVSFGWSKKFFQVMQITSLKMSCNPVASAGRSFKRLELYTSGGDLILISPKKRDEFIRTLRMINPNIIME